MSFDVAQFSQAGLNALAELTAQKTLKIMQIFVDENVMSSSSDLNQTPAWWATETASTVAKINSKIMSIGVTNGQARIVLDLSLKDRSDPIWGHGNPTTTTVKTVVISACTTENGVDDSEIILCGISDPNGIDIIYNDSVPVSIKINVYFKFNNASNITVLNAIAPDYALQGDLERFVSCHASGAPYTGENQIIYGEKQFLEPQHFGSDSFGTGAPQIIISTSNTNLNSSIVSLTQPEESEPPSKQILTFHSAEENYMNEPYGCLSTNVNIIPNWDDAPADVTLGNSNAHFAEGYIDNIYCSGLTVKTGQHWGVDFKSLDTSSTYGTINYDPNSTSLDFNTTSGIPMVLNAENSSLNLNGKNIYFRTDARALEDLTVDGDLIANVGRITSLTATTLTVNSNMEVWGDVTFNGRVNLDANLITSGLTTNVLTFNTDLSYGNSPFVPSNGNIKTGCIILAMIVFNETLSPMRAGEFVPASCDIYMADVENAQWNTNGSNYMPCYMQGMVLPHDGTNYRFLCDAYNRGNNWVYGRRIICPIICVNGD